MALVMGTAWPPSSRVWPLPTRRLGARSTRSGTITDWLSASRPTTQWPSAPSRTTDGTRRSPATSTGVTAPSAHVAPVVLLVPKSMARFHMSPSPGLGLAPPTGGLPPARLVERL